MVIEPAPYRPFLEALLAFDVAGAQQAAREALGGGIPYLYERIVEPALDQVGVLWAENRITTADEHAATAIAQTALALLYPEFPWSAGGPRGVVACVRGELHQLGARMVADLLVLGSWDIVFLGADTPAGPLAGLVARISPVFVGLSASLPSHLPAVREAARAIRSECPGVRLLAGGRVLRSAGSDAAAELGVDAVARSAAEAVEVARSWRP